MLFLDLFIVGTIPALINLLKGSKIKLQCKTVGLLSNISTHPSIVHALVEAGAIPALINLLVSEEPELHSRCAVILYDIAQLENKDVIAKHVSSFHRTSFWLSDSLTWKLERCPFHSAVALINSQGRIPISVRMQRANQPQYHEDQSEQEQEQELCAQNRHSEGLCVNPVLKSRCLILFHFPPTQSYPPCLLLCFWPCFFLCGLLFVFYISSHLSWAFPTHFTVSCLKKSSLSTAVSSVRPCFIKVVA